MAANYYKDDACGTDTNIGYLIRRSALLMTEHIESVFQAHGISFTQWLSLKILDNGGPMPMHELCGHIGYDPATLSRAIERLRIEGLVARNRSNADRRSVELSLTREGRAYVKKHSAVALQELNALLEDFSRAEADTLIALMQRVLAKLTQAHEKRRAEERKRAS